MSIRDLTSLSNRCKSCAPTGRALTISGIAAAVIVLGCVTLTHTTIGLAEKAMPPEVGFWIDDTGQGGVEIRPCGRNLCAHIVWLQDPMSKKGGPKRDIYNPNVKNKAKPICGLQIIGSLVPQSDRSWDNGWIYDPKIGQAFDLAIRAISKTKLELRGYKGVKILGKTFYWTRAKTNLPRCDADNQTTAGQ